METETLYIILVCNLALAFCFGTYFLSSILPSSIQQKADALCMGFGYRYYDPIQRDCYYDDWNYDVIRENGSIVDLRINNFKHYSEMDKGKGD